MRWSCVLLAACSASVTHGTPDSASTQDAAVQDTDGAHSGQRLKIVWYQFNDGTRTFDGTLYDVERKENCFIFENWTDGKSYCAPAKANSNVVYTDASCTQKAVQIAVDPSCPQTPPPSIIDFDFTACSVQPARAYQRGAQLSVSSYFVNYGFGCEGPFSESGGNDYYALGAEIKNLAEVTLDAPAGNGRVTSRFYTSSDGLHYPARLHDSQLGLDCYASYLGAGSTQSTCNPYDAGFFDYFRDASCTQSVLAETSGCPVPSVAVRYDTSCANDPGHYFRVGAQTAASTLFTGDPNTCSSLTAPSGEDFYAAGGSELATASLSRAPDSTGHRIELEHVTTTDGLKFRDSSLYDTTTGSECFATTMPDGSKLCFPYAYGIDTMYGDPQCTQPVDVVQVFTGDASCTQVAPPMFAEKYIAPVPGACNPTYELHAIAGVHAGTLYEDFGSCQAYTPFESTVYDVGPVAPYSTFAVATRVTDP